MFITRYACDNPDRILSDMYYALYVSVSGGSTPKAVEVIEGEPGGNKDEGIGVGGWTIPRDHPMKPSAVQGILDVPYHGEVLLEMAKGKRRTWKEHRVKKGQG